MAVLLYNRSCYSLLSSTITIDKLISFARENQYKSIGLVDTNNLFAGCQFIRKCQQNNIHPILGMEVKAVYEEKNYSFLLYPFNNDGYRELLKLTSQLNYENCTLNYDQIKGLSKNIAVVVNYLNSILESWITHDDKDNLEKYLSELAENFYLAIGPQNSQYNRQYREYLLLFKEKYNLHLLPLKQAVYTNRNEYQAYQVAMAIGHQTTYTDDQLTFNEEGWLTTYDEIEQQFSFNELLETDKFASKVSIDIDAFKTGLPVYQNKDGIDSKTYLRELCQTGLKKRLNGRVSREYIDRLNEELDLICRMNFEDYFLIIYDIVLQARKEDINIGPGRGSAVGSLAAYCLGITHLDPIRYHLYFERFLNPERVKMPDIDIDIPDNNRSDIIRYVQEKYGSDRVAHIITFSSLAARAVIRDVGNAMNADEQKINALLGTLDKNSSVSLKSSYQNNSAFRKLIDGNDDLKTIVRNAMILEGLPRNLSTHASGIVISRQSIDEVVPVTSVSGALTTQYSMEYLEDFGLIKFDFLGLRNLTTIAQINKSIDPHNRNIDILKLPLDDINTYKLIDNVDTNGIFQLEKEAMKIVTRKLQPKDLEEVAVVLALGRPGSSAFTDQYVKNKENPDNIRYLHEDFRDILQDTKGIIIYQEQIMQIAQKIAGFSLGKANLLREAISKKKAEKVENLKKDFFEGALAKGYSRSVVEQSYELILRFASYGFNKSHAIAYALIAYQLAYYKANFPLHFYKAILNSVLGSSEKINMYIRECKSKSIKVLPPDVNYSTSEFEIVNNSIIMPLTSIRTISKSIADSIIREREDKGVFSSYPDFYRRFAGISTDQKYVEALIRGCALDSFGYSHTSLLSSLNAFSMMIKSAMRRENDQLTLDFDLIQDDPVIMPYVDNQNDLLEDQFSYLGVYLNALPTESYRSQISGTMLASDIRNHHGQVKAILMVNSIKQHRTKRGELMAFVSCMDESGYLDLAIMPNNYSKYAQILKKGIIISVEGIKDERDSLKVDRLNWLKG